MLLSRHTRRREFITLLGGTVAAWPLAARAQQPAMPVIGFLQGGAPDETAPLVAEFRKGLSENGYEEGRNVLIEYRWAHHDNSRLPELAADLVRRGVAVIATPASTRAALAAKAATATIPVVFGTGLDPVALGLVTSFNRPDGNVTGFTTMNAELVGKQLGLLHELLPAAARFGVLVNPKNPLTDFEIKEAQAAGSAIGREIVILNAGSAGDINTAFAVLREKRTDALLISADILFENRRIQIVTLATRHAVPTISLWQSFAEAGGLMSYGSSVDESFRQIGIYAGRILKGAKVADLPVVRQTKFEFVINLQTAMVFGLDVPATLTARADVVIQ
jgi:putative ABC transport system substrate-binding protein